jgi:hypothetical protein
MSGGRPSYQLDGDYRYLSEAYYQSVDALNAGRPVAPTPQQILDALIVPLALCKAELAGLAVPEWYLTNEYFRPPVVCYTVNPFMRRSATVLQQGRAKAVARRMTRNGQYAVCCQEIEADTDVREFNVLLGRTAQPDNAEWAARVWEVFGLPLVRVRLLDFGGGRRMLSALEPLPRKTLKAAEQRMLDEALLAAV